MIKRQMVEVKKYYVGYMHTGEDQEDFEIIECQSPGMAVNYFLACRGMLRYDPDRMQCFESEDIATEVWESVKSIYGELSQNKLKRLNEHHKGVINE